jgi:hypothetical protein
MQGVVSRHPAERGDVRGMAVATQPFRFEITRAGTLISRFSTVPFEAMARGVPFVYHNPHRERVPTFTDPLDAFRITGSTSDLVQALKEATEWRDDYRSRAGAFFLRQIDVDDGRTSEARTADVISRCIG